MFDPAGKSQLALLPSFSTGRVLFLAGLFRDLSASPPALAQLCWLMDPGRGQDAFVLPFHPLVLEGMQQLAEIAVPLNCGTGCDALPSIRSRAELQSPFHCSGCLGLGTHSHSCEPGQFSAEFFFVICILQALKTA